MDSGELDMTVGQLLSERISNLAHDKTAEIEALRQAIGQLTEGLSEVRSGVRRLDFRLNNVPGLAETRTSVTVEIPAIDAQMLEDIIPEIVKEKRTAEFVRHLVMRFIHGGPAVRKLMLGGE